MLDLERMAVGDPLIDVANLAIQLRMLGHRPEFSMDVATARRWAQEFLDRWQSVSGEPINPTRYQCFAAISLLVLARGMMRHLRDGWRALARVCVELAEGQLAAAGREAVVP